ILRCLLSSYLGKSSQSIEIVYGMWGKPCLVDEKAVYFNLSHSKDYALYAFSPQCEVGVDIEYIQKDFNSEEIAKNIFSLQEQARLRLMLSEEEKVRAFFKMWVCQEAFLKAKGKGWLSNDSPPFVHSKEFIEGKVKNPSFQESRTFLYYFESIPEYASALFMDGPSKIRHYVWQ